MPWPELHAGTNFNYVWDTNTLAWVKETQPSGGGGTGATIGAAVPATATAVAVKDNAGNLAYPNLDVSGNLLVAVTGAGSGGTSSVDGSGYTAGTTAGTPVLGAVDDTGTTACAEDKVGIARITPQRGLHTNLRTQAGVEAGTSSSPLQVSLANTAANGTAVKVDNSGVTQPVKLETQLDYDTGAGTVPTSIVGIALPASGGAVAGGTTTNPVQVALPAATVSTLTPPAAITGFALDATLTGRTAHIQITDGTRDGTVKAASTLAVSGDTAVVVAVRDALPLATAGGYTSKSFAAAANDNATSLKGTAGQLYGVHVYNNAAYPVYLKFYNKATTPAPATDNALLMRRVGIQAGTKRDITFPAGIPFSTGIGYALVKGIGDTDDTSVAANDALVDIDYN